jgi:catechol 2,3-dioxygenase-like lactoylglutathione lyase family enzyme
MMTTSGPGFISLQVRDVPRSAAFYEKYLGLTRQAGPPHAVVFGTTPAAFAVRTPVDGVDLDSVSQLGLGVGIWLHAPEAQIIHDTLTASPSPPHRSMVRSGAPSLSPTPTATRSPSTTGPDHHDG